MDGLAINIITPFIDVVCFQVCNKPLDPEDDSCNIQNIWAYWQDSLDNFKTDETDDQYYLGHALKCFSNPSYTNPLESVLSCLGKNGVPVQPYYVLGGFIPEDVDGFPEDPTYEKATAVLLQASEMQGFSGRLCKRNVGPTNLGYPR